MTITRKLRGRDDSAHCRDCGFYESHSHDGKSTKIYSAARRHVIKTGHSVEIYYESGRVIKPS